MVRRMVQRAFLLSAAGCLAGVLLTSHAHAQMTMQQCLAKNYTYNVCKNYPAAVGVGKSAKPGQTVRREEDMEDQDSGLRPEAIWPAYGCWNGGDLKACQAAQQAPDRPPPLLDYPNLLQDGKYSLDLPNAENNLPGPPDDKLTLPGPGGTGTP
jgi:hypothetical protein